MINSEEQSTETRRTVLKYLGSATGLIAAGGLATSDPFVHPVAALGTDESAFRRLDRRIESFDGTELSATLYEPTADGPHPAILMTHGWGGNKSDLQPLAEVYASNGFVALAYTSRGFGQGEEADGSGGEVHSTSELERRDASALIDYLARQDAVVTDGENDPRIGMDGTSYGGGIQLRTASVDDRLDSIVPRATWNDLAQALAPNGVIKRGWIRALELGAQSGNISEENTRTTSGVLERGRMTEADREYYRRRSPVTYDDIEDTPALLIPELTDQLFPINQGVRNFRKLRDDGSRTTLVLGQDGTHILGQPDDYPPGSETSRQFVGRLALRWQEAQLKETDLDVSTLHYYDGSTDEFAAADEFPPHPTRSTTVTVPEPIELDGADGNVASLDIEIEEPTEILGLPSISLDLRPTGDGRSHLFVALQRVRDGDATTIKQQVTPLAVTDAGAVELELFGVHANLAAGDTLRLAMSAREDELTSAAVIDLFGGSLYRPSDDDAGIEIAADTEVELSLPASRELSATDTTTATDTDESEETDATEAEGANGSGDGSDEEQPTTTGGQPGYGALATVGSIAGLGYLLSRRSDRTEPADDRSGTDD